MRTFTKTVAKMDQFCRKGLSMNKQQLVGKYVPSHNQTSVENPRFSSMISSNLCLMIFQLFFSIEFQLFTAINRSHRSHESHSSLDSAFGIRHLFRRSKLVLEIPWRWKWMTIMGISNWPLLMGCHGYIYVGDGWI